MVDLFDTEPDAPVDLNGVTIWSGWLDDAAQSAMLAELRDVARAAPLRQYETPGGQKMSVRMTAAGEVGWVTDKAGYRYAPCHADGGAWPDIPASVLAVWRAVSGVDRDPDSCLVNFYGEGAKMGLHQDKDEADPRWPVVSISLGDPGLFRVGGHSRKDPTKSRWLNSGDVAVLAGEARLAFHGIDRIKFGEGEVLPEGGRINVTLRVAQ
ncbi:alpha-ketoglutarate-dependent dioxygenase AlkB [Boseongicola aestuarii]|uniref:Alpha-ketoglutarate-dependent dioxygenase AlkB n=1 Tax=Boseongicola aestuarii TaxID=1470561 RepID=A0A238J2S1_9RHOB|nr:alpha-ketoglutarate-dependent dioxygenase AlkB [Boseongicola aestuarii]SMX24917.1 Alpha-ketoglutarate-dependent dioxygenase AlkB [Boseongicola aestuarii]